MKLSFGINKSELKLHSIDSLCTLYKHPYGYAITLNAVDIWISVLEHIYFVYFDWHFNTTVRRQHQRPDKKRKENKKNCFRISAGIETNVNIFHLKASHAIHLNNSHAQQRHFIPNPQSAVLQCGVDLRRINGSLRILVCLFGGKDLGSTYNLRISIESIRRHFCYLTHFLEEILLQIGIVNRF